MFGNINPKEVGPLVLGLKSLFSLSEKQSCIIVCIAV